MSDEKSLQTSPQLAFDEQTRVAVALSHKQILSIYKKSESSGYPFDTLKEVYERGYWENLSEQEGFNRVNSFIAGGAAAEMDRDLIEGYIHIGPAGAKSPYNQWGDKRRGTITLGNDSKWAKRDKEERQKPGKNINDRLTTSPRRESVDEAGEDLIEKRGLWDNIHAKQERIKHGSGERMRKPGEKGRPTKQDFINSQEEYTGAEKVSANKNDPSNRFVGTDSLTNNFKNATPGQSTAYQTVKRVVREAIYGCGCNGNCKCGKEEVQEDSKGYKSETGGLTQKGRDHYNRTTGSNLKAPVTKKPSELKKGSKAANRRKSFCARMGGMKKRLTSAKTANDPDSRINKALRKWNC